MTEQRTPYAATETALPASAIADTPQDWPQPWTADRHAMVKRHIRDLLASGAPNPQFAYVLAGLASVHMEDALAHIEYLTTDVVHLRGLVESVQHAANADTMPADEALTVIRGLVEGVGR